MRDDVWGSEPDDAVDEGGSGEPTPAAVRQAAAHLRRGREPDARAVARIMDAVRRRPAPRRVRTPAWRRLTTARTWRLSPIAAAALAASLVGVGALGAWRVLGDRSTVVAAGDVDGRPLPPAGAAPTHVVRFVLSAPSVSPGVSRVTLVGDFNGWQADATPMRWDAASRSWTAVVALPAGRYVYAFVLDGRRWVADPSAPLAPEDGFGAPNSVVLVGNPGGSI